MSLVFCSWSGGKDCCLALYRAMKNGLEIRYLANTISEDGKRSRSHGISSEVIKAQAQALGIPIVQRRTTNENYESVSVDMLRDFKREGIEGGVFGDIDFDPHREWDEKVCRQASIKPYLPLWQEDQKALMQEFIEAGFESVIITVKSEFLGEEMLGRKVDKDFVKHMEEMAKTSDITPAGEAGEYHTLVIDGPIFKKRLEILESDTIEREGYWYLQVHQTGLKDK
jgi:diphthine-ammonia ligase